MLTVNTDSDLVYAMTSYINSDPEARAWLNGKPDPWGMVVNPNYKKIALPVDNWPLLDSFEPLAEYQPGRNDCLYYDPLPYLPLVAAPTARLFSIGQDMQFALVAEPDDLRARTRSIHGRWRGRSWWPTAGRRPARDSCSAPSPSATPRGRACRWRRSRRRRPVSPQTAITSTAGRTFVAPTTLALKAAAQALKPDKKSRHLADPVRRLPQRTRLRTPARWSCTQRSRPRAAEGRRPRLQQAADVRRWTRATSGHRARRSRARLPADDAGQRAGRHGRRTPPEPPPPCARRPATCRLS